MEFLESVIDDAESGEHIQVSFERHRYPDLTGTPIDKFCYLAIAQGLALLPPLRELAKQCKFQIERERAIEVEIAPARATLKLLTYLPALILIGAAVSNVMPVNKNLLTPIPLAMVFVSLTFQVIGRRWSERIIERVRK